MAPRITTIENIYQHQPTNNGAGPFWCLGCTTLVSTPSGDLYMTSFEKTDEAIPYQNVKWALWRRTTAGWKKVHQDTRRTREPSPLVVLPGQNIGLISTNPTLTAPDVQAGPAEPEARVFRLDTHFSGGETGASEIPTREGYVFPAGHYFGEHSYRSFVADGESGEVLEFHQVDDGDQVWSFRNATGKWGHPGRLTWPWGADYAKPQAIRVCYPSVLLKNRAVYFCGVSDIMEPNPAWREAKFRITGKKWDYDFRRLFFTWTPDITSAALEPWMEVSGREATCGWIFPCDMIHNDDAANSVTALWVERALDERLRPEFFPNEKQSWSLKTARITQGKVECIHHVAHLEEGQAGHTARFGRFHQTADGRRFVVATVGDPHVEYGSHEKSQCSLELIELAPDGGVKSTHTLGHTVAQPFFFVATPRAGCPLTDAIHVLAEGPDRWMQYLKIEL